MNAAKKFNFSNLGGFALGMLLSLALLLLLVGCAGMPRSGTWSKRPTTAQIQAVLDGLDHYIYFAGYEIYYNPAREEYTFWSERAWVTRRDPPAEISVDVLLASPSVAMSFNDVPARHHAAMSRLYPRNWGRVEVALASAQ